MKKILPLVAVLGMAYVATAQQNVGIGTNNPETKLQINGAISFVPAEDNAAASVTIPDNVSAFRLKLIAGGGTTALGVNNGKEGQVLTIYNQDDNTATFAGTSIIPTTGSATFMYINGAWRMTASNSAAGPQGPAGPQGATGPTGAQGTAGAAGPQGPAGPQGAQGIQGVAGAAGAQGATGPTGAQGTAGAAGPQGPAGPQGAQGIQGVAGAAGAQGATGPTGAQGTAGAAGPQGPAGPQGAQGIQGTQGPAGAAGAAGPQGPTGLLSNGTVAGNTTYWNGSTWVLNNANIFNNGGNVGIGTSSPGEKLHVNGGIRTENTVINSGGDHLELMRGVRGDDDAYEWIGLYSGANRQGIFLWDGAWTGANNVTNELSLTAENGNLLTLNNRGNHIALMPGNYNVGIGTLSPKATLSVSSSSNDMINLYSPSDNRLSIQTTLDNQALGTYGADAENRLALQPLVGRVGIGTTEPTHKLHVAGDVKLTGYEYINNSSPTIYLQDADNQTGMIHMNSDLMYFLSGSGANTTNWTVNGSNWPLTINMSNDVSTFGGAVNFVEGAVTVNNLAGTGNRAVYADANGVLKAGTGNDNTTWTMSANFSHSPDDWCTGCVSTGWLGGNAAATSDDAVANITMPFSVTINGTSYNTLSACTNGWISFGTTSLVSYSNTALPTSSITNTPIIFPYWDDLKDWGDGEYVRWGSVGTSPNQTFIVDYSMRSLSTTSSIRVNFQVQIHESSGLINVKYRDAMESTMNGQSATIGFQLDGGSSAKAYPIVYNGKVLDDNRDDSEGWSVCPVR